MTSHPTAPSSLSNRAISSQGVADNNPYASPPAPADENWMQQSSFLGAEIQPTASDLLLPGGDERLWAVVPIKRMPFRELRSLTRNFFEYLLVLFVFKLLRVPNRPSWAAALLDQREIGEQDIPELFVADFEKARREATALGFVDPHYVSSPTVGPRMSVEMLMTTPDGRVQLSFHRLVTIDGFARLDETRRGLHSRLAGDRSLVTMSNMPTPRPSEWQVVTRMRTKSFEKLLERHRKQLAEHPSRPIEPSRTVEESMREDHRLIHDVIQRGLLREANGNDILNITQSYG